MIENLDQGRAVALERSESQLDLRRYLGIVLEYKGAILAMALMVALVGLYMALKAVPIYGSTAKLQIERQTGSGDFGQQLVGWYRNKEFYATQVELIRSWGVAEIAASKLGLLEDISMPSSLPTDDDGAFQWRNLMPELLRKEPRTLSATECAADIGERADAFFGSFLPADLVLAREQRGLAEHGVEEQPLVGFRGLAPEGR